MRPCRCGQARPPCRPRPRRRPARADRAGGRQRRRAAAGLRQRPGTSHGSARSAYRPPRARRAAFPLPRQQVPGQLVRASMVGGGNGDFVRHPHASSAILAAPASSSRHRLPRSSWPCPAASRWSPGRYRPSSSGTALAETDHHRSREDVQGDLLRGAGVDLVEPTITRRPQGAYRERRLSPPRFGSCRRPRP